MSSQKDIFSSLKKCNQIGKKLSTSGKYILIDGMMIGYQKPKMDETEANGLGISFIENKLLSKMDGLPYIGVEIDGNELYQVYQDSEFIKFMIDSTYLYLEFKSTETEEESDGFKELALEKGFKESDIDIGLATNFDSTTDIDLYELYINYKKTYKPKTKVVTKTIKYRIIKNVEDCKILRKTRKVFKRIENAKFLGYKELQPEIFDKLFNATQPIEIKINNEITNDVFILRLMKSVLNTATSKSNCEMRLLDCGEYSYLIVEIGISGFITCNIYRVVNY